MSITNKTLKNNKAFTLIEVVIAVAILSTLSVLVATSLSRALKAKKKIQAEVTDVSSLRDAMKVLRADIQQAYNHVDFEKEIIDQIPKAKTQAPAAGTNPYQQPQQPLIPPRQNKREDPRTAFVGTDNKMNFVTMNNARMMAGEMQADFIEVGYEVKTCQNLSNADQSSQCLFRRVQKILDQDVEKGGLETVILENVTEFSIRYLIEGKEDWVKEWKSVPTASSSAPLGSVDMANQPQMPTSANPAGTATGGSNISRATYPDAIEVTLAIERELDKKKRKYSLQYVIPVHFPNNYKAPTSSSGAGAAQPGGSAAGAGGSPGAGTGVGGGGGGGR